MATYSDAIARGTLPSYSATPGAHPLIPEDVQRDIIKGATNKSAALSMFKTRTMPTSQQRIPILSTKPTAAWLTAEAGLKQTTTLSWDNLFLYAEELAVIVPVSINLLKDVDYKLWDEIKPEIEEAIAFALDMAVFFGIDKPASWTASVVGHAAAASNTVTVGTQTPNDIAAELNALLGALEADGYNADGFYIRNNVQSTLRGLRAATTNEFIFLPANPGLENTAFKGNIYGLKTVAAKTGTFEAYDAVTANATKAIAGQWDAGIVGIRQDVTGELFREGVIQNASGQIEHNLMQQDMVAMRFVARYGFAIANPVNRMNSTTATRSPFAVLLDAA